MKTRLITVWTLALAASTAALLWSSTRAAQASTRLLEARERYLLVRAQVEELERLHALAPRGEEFPTAPEDLPRRVSGAIRASGLPSSAMASFDAGGTVLDGNTLTRRASLVLKEVTLPQTGRFLSEWRRAEPRWTIASVELSPRGQAPAAGGDLPLQAVISMESSVRAPGAHP